MYINYYGLKKQPFHITPDPEFLYLSPSHKEALAAIIYGIEQRKGFVAITGDVGVGKTTILRSYLEDADKKHLKIIYIFNAKLTFDGLLKTIYQEMGLQIESGDVVELVNKLYEVLIEEYKQGNTVVLVIDEAQNMPVETLENLRMISNLETSKDKLIQIVLVGQTEFEELLNLNRLRQFKQRLAIRATILPLKRNESFEYIAFRLRKAGTYPKAIFTQQAMKKIVDKACGIPRVLNVLCDNALITGFGYRQKPVTKRIAKEIIRDFEGRNKKSFFPRWALGTLVVVIILLAGISWFIQKGDFFAGKEIITPQVMKEISETVKAETKPETSFGEKSGEVSDAISLHEPSVSEKIVEMEKKVPLSVAKTVVRGNTLTGLAQEVYGVADEKIIGMIQKENPQINDPNIIHTGSTIIFPNLPKHETGTQR